MSAGRAVLSAAEKELFVFGGRYQVLEQVSRGRTSAVYRALDRESGATVAVKRLDLVALVTPQEKRQALTAFERECAVLERSPHPGLVPVLGHFRERDSVVVVMAWVEGATLDELRRRGPLPEPQVRALGIRLAEAIGFLHGQEPPILLRDLKPAHVMIDSRGEPVLLDLGLSRLFRAGQSRGAADRGTPPFEAPEQAEGGYALPQSDVFALGTLLLVLARGPKRAGASTVLSPSFRRALARCRRTDPEKRWPTMERFRRALAVGTQPDADVELPAPVAATSGASPAEATASESPAEVPPAPRRAVRSQVAVLTKRLRIIRRPGKARAAYRLRLRSSAEEPVSVRVQSGAPWLTVGSDHLLVDPGAEAEVAVTVDLASAPAAGTRVAHAVLIADGGRRWVSAEVVEPQPSLEVAETLLDFGALGAEEASASFAVRNGGGGSLAARISSSLPWVVVPRPDVTLEGGQSLPVQVRLRAEDAAAEGTYPNALLIDSDVGQAQVGVTFSRGRAELSVQPASLSLGAIRYPEAAEAEVVLSNTGSAPVTARITSGHASVTVSHGHVTLPARHRARIVVCLDTRGLPPGRLSISQAVRIGSPVGGRNLDLEGDIVRPLLAVSDTEFDLGELTPERLSTTTAPLLLSNRGNADLTFELEPQVPWLQGEPAQGRLSGGASTIVTLSLTGGGDLAPGGHEASPAIVVHSQGGAIALSARLRLIRPLVAVEPASLDFGVLPSQGVGERRLELSNPGTGDLAWQAKTDAPWIELSPAAGRCPEGDTVTVTVRAYGLALPSGTGQARGRITFSGPYGTQSVPVTVALSQPILTVEPVAELGPSVDLAPAVGQVILFNRGVGDLKATVQSSLPWVSIPHPEVSIASGRSSAVEVVVQPPADWEPGEHLAAAALQISSNGGEAEVDLRATVVVQAQIELTPDRLVLKPGGEGAIIVRNVGRGAAEGAVRSSAPWVQVQPRQVTIRPGRRARLQVTVSGDAPSTYDGSALVSVTVGELEKTVEVVVTA